MANYTLNYTGEDVDRLLEKIDTAFGEKTTYSDTLTWDGNTDGLYSVMGMFYHLSGVVPTLEDLQNGGTITMFTPDGEVNGEFTAENVMDAETIGMGTNLVVVQTDMGGILIATEDGAIMTEDDTSITFDKAGIYFGGDGSAYTSSFTINNYTFTKTEVKTIDPKYLPSGAGGANATFTVESSGIGISGGATVTCDKSLTELMPLSLEELYNVNIIWVVEGSPMCLAKPITVVKMEVYNSVMFGFTTTVQGRNTHYYIAFDDGEPIIESIES